VSQVCGATALFTYAYRFEISAVIQRLYSPFVRHILVTVPARSCRVSFVDSERIEHAVEVVASSLYEAAVLAMAEFRRCGFADATFGPATRLTVRVKAPEEEHTVALSKLRSVGWWGEESE
jgi:hypothetical protein